MLSEEIKDKFAIVFFCLIILKSDKARFYCTWDLRAGFAVGPITQGKTVSAILYVDRVNGPTLKKKTEKKDVYICGTVEARFQCNQKNRWLNSYLQLLARVIGDFSVFQEGDR